MTIVRRLLAARDAWGGGGPGGGTAGQREIATVG